MKNKPKLTRATLFRYALQGAILAILASAAVVFFTLSEETLHHLQSFRWELALFMLATVIIAWTSNAFRVFILSRSLGYKLRIIQCFSVSLSSEFGITATPAGMGGAAIRLGLLKRAGVPLAHGTSMLTTDIAMDICFFILLFPFAIYALLNNQEVLQHIYELGTTNRLILLGIIAVLIILVAILIRRGALRYWINLLHQLPHSQRYRLPARSRWLKWKFVKEFLRMKEGLHHLFRMRWGSVFLSFLLASLQWTCRYSLLPLILYAFSMPNDPILLFFLQGLLFFISFLIVLPGGGGGVEVLAAVILNQIIPLYLVGVVILIWRFFTYHLYLFGGGTMFFYTCAKIHDIYPQDTIDTDQEDINFSENGNENE